MLRNRFAVLTFNYLHYHRHYYVHDVTLVISKICVFFGVSLQTDCLAFLWRVTMAFPYEFNTNTTHSRVTADYSAGKTKW